MSLKIDLTNSVRLYIHNPRVTRNWYWPLLCKILDKIQGNIDKNEEESTDMRQLCPKLTRSPGCRLLSKSSDYVIEQGSS